LPDARGVAIFFGVMTRRLLLLLIALSACKREPVREDVKEVARTTEKAAKDLGHAAAEGGQDAWITTKVKSELASKGVDPLHVHVDTDHNVVTLSGTVASAEEREKAVAIARGVKDVASVTDHLFVGPPKP
jgi:osmotically-inducible protein OsmY